jgi:DNA-binding transcriptional regulator WhiA
MEIPADPDQQTDSNEQSLLREKKLLEKLQMWQKMRIENPELSLRQLAQMTGTSRVTLTKYRINIPSS